MLNNYYYAEGRGHQLLAYRSCSSPNQVPLQRPVINKQKARGTSWAVFKKSIVLSYSSHKMTGYFRFLAHRPCPAVIHVRQSDFKKLLINRAQYQRTELAKCVAMDTTDDFLRHSFRERSLEEKLEIKRLGPESPPGPQTPCHLGLCPTNAHTHEPPLEAVEMWLIRRIMKVSWIKRKTYAEVMDMAGY
ncbi:hypothetical protein PoB_000615900 [Plakobranchus ocellatus]|uniref:Uncharacterized protein n=1 Tax=Plakobranchus ocellatus TaxID=259542 RepID=A0AAV3YBJ1_9GAST|nr:hypothetical protein PoB_000615900 [Plakobranchus ocellatus]